MANEKILNAYRNAARDEHHSEGSCEIDDNALVNPSDDGGAYVQAWVWVDDSDANICTNCRNELTDDGQGHEGLCGTCADAAENESNSDQASFEPWSPDSHWTDHESFPIEDWIAEVAAGDTRQSYVQWVNSRLSVAEE